MPPLPFQALRVKAHASAPDRGIGDAQRIPAGHDPDTECPTEITLHHMRERQPPRR